MTPDWRPIAEAPKNERLLLLFPHRLIEAVAGHRGGRTAVGESGCFKMYFGEWGSNRKQRPTHWMPLPDELPIEATHDAGQSTAGKSEG